MIKYKIIRTKDSIDEGKLNALGRANWILCSVTNDEFGFVYYFRKES